MTDEETARDLGERYGNNADVIYRLSKENEHLRSALKRIAHEAQVPEGSPLSTALMATIEVARAALKSVP